METIFLDTSVNPFIEWGQFGVMGAIIGFVLWFILRPLVNSHIEFNKSVSESIKELPATLVEIRNTLANAHNTTKEQLDRNYDILKEIQTKLNQK